MGRNSVYAIVEKKNNVYASAEKKPEEWVVLHVEGDRYEVAFAREDKFFTSNLDKSPPPFLKPADSSSSRQSSFYRADVDLDFHRVPRTHFRRQGAW